MKPVSHELGHVEISRDGGAKDGMSFQLVNTQMDNGEVLGLWVCNTLPGYYKQVFVPWDFEHPSIVDF